MPYVRASRHGAVSAGIPSTPGDFGGQNTEAPPLPLSSRFSRFGTVSDRTHLQGLSPLSWLSFSPWAVWAQRRSRSRDRFHLSPGRKLPTQAEVERAGTLPGKASHSPNPLDGILTRFDQDGFGHCLPKSFHVAPIQEPSGALLSDRTPGLLRLRPSGLQRQRDASGITPTSLRRTGGATLAANPALRAST